MRQPSHRAARRHLGHGRSCGQCMACCTTHAVPALMKREGTPCNRLGANGCKDFVRPRHRPLWCSAYQCAYLRRATDALGIDGAAGRPDRLGLVIDAEEIDGVGRTVIAREVYPGVAKVPGHAAFLRGLNEHFSIWLFEAESKFDVLYLGALAPSAGRSAFMWLGVEPACVVPYGAAAWEVTGE